MRAPLATDALQRFPPTTQNASPCRALYKPGLLAGGTTMHFSCHTLTPVLRCTVDKMILPSVENDSPHAMVSFDYVQTRSGRPRTQPVPGSTYLVTFRTICKSGQSVVPLKANTYLTRRLAQREICGFGDYALEIFGLMVGMFMVGIAWHTLRHPKEGESAPPTSRSFP